MSGTEAIFWRPRFLGQKLFCQEDMVLSGALVSPFGIKVLFGGVVPCQLSGARRALKGQLDFQNSGSGRKSMYPLIILEDHD